VTRRRIELLLWLLAGATALTGGLRWRNAEPRPSLARSAAIPTAPAVAAPPPAGSLAMAVRLSTARDVFRLDRSPAPLPFTAQPAGFEDGAPPPPIPTFRPPLAISGIVGPPWQAFLEGVPGRDASVVVQPGDTLAGLRIRAIGPDLVVVQGADTTWRLTLRKPWQ
jgi:hypothetical protein